MKYWAYFTAKTLVVLALATTLLWGLRKSSVRRYSTPVFTPRIGYHLVERVYVPKFGYDLPFTSAVGGWFLFSCGLAYLAVLDQKYRCRVCLRRLRMPVQTGSWASMLLWGRPKTEYICPYGHGRLNVDDLQITGSETPEWTPQTEDPWQELCHLMKSDGRK